MPYIVEVLSTSGGGLEMTSANIDPSPFIYHNEGEARVRKYLDLGCTDIAVDELIRCVGSFYSHPSLIGQSLYLKGFDELLDDISKKLPLIPSWRIEESKNDLFILSEYYAGGGHCLVAEQIIKLVHRPVILIVDFFYNHSTGKNIDHKLISQRLPGVDYYFIEGTGFLEKVLNLKKMLFSLKPRTVAYLTHHPDPVPFLASDRLPAHVRKIFIHHADHRPALGCSLNGYIHVDLSETLRDMCEKHLQIRTELIPLSVVDLGKKNFSRPTREKFNVVSAGSNAKYAYQGECSLLSVVQDFMRETQCIFYQIGSLPEHVIKEIQNYLMNSEIDINRFQYLGPVDSLWRKLIEIDAHFYIGSFPLNGGRGSIEAQGCGYPTFFYRSQTLNSPLLQPNCLFADRENYWESTSQLISKINRTLGCFDASSTRARSFYLNSFTESKFSKQAKMIWSGNYFAV